MTAKALVPEIIEAFTYCIKHLKREPATPENKEEGKAIIMHFVGRLQLADLSLSQQDALNILADAYRTI